MQFIMGKGCNSPLRLDTQCILRSVVIYPCSCWLAFALFIALHRVPQYYCCWKLFPIGGGLPQKTLFEENWVCLPPGKRIDSPLPHTLQEGKPDNTWQDTAYSSQKNRLERPTVLLKYLVWVHQKKFKKIGEALSQGNLIFVCLAVTGCSKVPESSGRVYALYWSIAGLHATVLPSTLHKVWSICHYYVWCSKANSLHSW